MKMMISAILGLHMLIGNFCMMQMTAFAKDMAMPQAQIDQEVMVMTPVEPMSPLHCKDCLHMQQEHPSPTSMQGNCDGHCLSSHTPTAAVVKTTSATQLPDVSTATSAAIFAPAPIVGLPLNTAPPNTLPMLINIGTVVFRE